MNTDAALLLEDCRCPSCSRVLKAGAGVFQVAVAGDVVEVCYYCLVEALRLEADERIAHELAPELELEPDLAISATAPTSPAPPRLERASWASIVDAHHQLLDHQLAPGGG